MRRRSGWCWTASTRGPWPGPARRPPGQLPGPRPPSSASVRGYRARRVARRVKALARDRLRAVAVDGKTCRRARHADGTRVHLLGVAEHGGHLLDHLEVGDGNNETSHFTALLGIRWTWTAPCLAKKNEPLLPAPDQGPAFRTPDTGRSHMERPSKSFCCSCAWFIRLSDSLALLVL